MLRGRDLLRREPGGQFTDEHGGDAGVGMGGVEVFERQATVQMRIGVADGAIFFQRRVLLGGGHEDVRRLRCLSVGCKV